MIWFGLVDLVFNESSFTLISWKAADKKKYFPLNQRGLNIVVGSIKCIFNSISKKIKNKNPPVFYSSEQQKDPILNKIVTCVGVGALERQYPYQKDGSFKVNRRPSKLNPILYPGPGHKVFFCVTKSNLKAMKGMFSSFRNTRIKSRHPKNSPLVSSSSD